MTFLIALTRIKNNFYIMVIQLTFSSCLFFCQQQYEKRRHSPHKKHSRQSNTGGKEDKMERGLNLKKFGFSDEKEEELFTIKICLNQSSMVKFIKLYLDNSW
jgi:hypothetical protein